MTVQTASKQPTAAQNQQTTSQVAGLIGAGLTASALTSNLIASLAAVGVTASAARAALTLVGVTNAPTVLPIGPASRATAVSEQLYRSAYLVNAAERIQSRVDRGMTLKDAVQAELGFYRQHLAAQANRRRVAEAVDKQARKSGSVLGWKARMDAKTSAECAAANGRNFAVRSRPAIGWPGSVHPHCRCMAVPAFTDAGWVDDVATYAEQRRAVAVG